MTDAFDGMVRDLDGWTRYQDPQGRYQLEHPACWTIVGDSLQILAQNPDHSTFVVAENFAPQPGETAMVFLARTPATHGSQFPKARMERVVQQTSAADEAVGALSFEGAQGPAKARLMCRISDNCGQFFAIVAPASQFDTIQPALIRMLQSVRFTATPASGESPKPVDSPAQKAADDQTAHVLQTTDTVHGVDGTAVGASDGVTPEAIKYVPWMDPIEGSFHVEVPEGWKVEGGAFRVGPTDIRQAIRVVSPGEGMAVLIGHPQLSNFTLPIPMYMQMGMREGQPLNQGTYQSMLYHYMPAIEFNRWFLHTHLAEGLENIAVQKELEQPEFSQNGSEAATRFTGGMTQVFANCGMTEFSGRSKQTGKPVTIIVRSTTYHYPPSPNGGIWYASPGCCVFNTDAGAETRRATTEAVFLHLSTHWQADPQWQQRTQTEQTQLTSQLNRMAIDAGRQAIEAAGERVRIQAQSMEARRASSMQSYWARTAAHDHIQRQVVNTIGDRTDVLDPTTGVAWNVPSGSNHYYLHPETNTIVATDSAYDPGVDFTKLSEI